MKINDSNGKIIDSRDISVHDDILNKLLFERLKRELCLSVSKSHTIKDEYFIKFVNVVGFEITSCDFWGASPHILDFEYVEHNMRELLPKLYQIKEKNQYQLCKLVKDKDYIETVMTFTSGDKLTVACEYIVVDL